MIVGHFGELWSKFNAAGGTPVLTAFGGVIVTGVLSYILQERKSRIEDRRLQPDAKRLRGEELYHQDERSFNRILLAVAASIAVLKGLRTPYAWALTQAQIDYHFGFLRRGLFGELCRQLCVPIWRTGVFTVLSFVLLGVLLGALRWAARTSGLDDAGECAFTALLAGSFCITMLVNLVGYFDITLILIALIVLSISRPELQLVAVGALGIVGVLIHELYAVAFLPVSLVGSVIWLSGKPSYKRALALFAAMIVPGILTFYIVQRPGLTDGQVTAIAHAMQARTNFTVDTGMLHEVLVTSSKASRAYMASLLSLRTWWVIEMFGLLAFLPVTLFFLALAWIWARPYGKAVQWFLVAATFAPLGLNLIGFDRYRWLMMMGMCSVLCAMGVGWQRTRSEDAPALMNIAWRRMAVLLLAVSLATNIGFFLGSAEGYPFMNYWWNVHAANYMTNPSLK
jgi:hypothetical protein